MTSTPQQPTILPMRVLRDRWYRGLVAALSLSPARFQIDQPCTSVPASDSSLWAIQNTLPPLSLTVNRNAENVTTMFSEYAAVAEQMSFPLADLAADIGEQNFAAWTAYVEQLGQPSAAQLPALFQEWALINAPDVANIGISDLATMALIETGAQALAPYTGPNAAPPDFARDYSDLVAMLAAAPGASVSFDSATTPADVTTTWTGGIDDGIDGLWSGLSPAARLSSTFASSHVTVHATFEHLVRWTSTPGAWYDSSLLGMAYSSPASPPWPADPSPTWEDLFGPSGSLQRLLASLLVVDGLQATITSSATYQAADQQAIADNAAAGLWPFYLHATSTAIPNTVSFDAAGTMTIAIAAEPNQPLILGGDVLGIAQYLGQLDPPRL
jgi:hypothetical protein